MPPSIEDREQRLARLQELRSQGVLSDEEYDAAAATLASDSPPAAEAETGPARAGRVVTLRGRTLILGCLAVAILLVATVFIVSTHTDSSSTPSRRNGGGVAAPVDPKETPVRNALEKLNSLSGDPTVQAFLTNQRSGGFRCSIGFDVAFPSLVIFSQTRTVVFSDQIGLFQLAIDPTLGVAGSHTDQDIGTGYSPTEYAGCSVSPAGTLTPVFVGQAQD